MLRKRSSSCMLSSYLASAQRRHSGNTNTVVNGVVELPIGQILRRWQPHVGSFRIQVLSDFGVPTSVIGVANRTVIGEVSPRFRHHLGRRGERSYLISGLRRYRPLPRGSGHVTFQRRRLVTRAEPATYRRKSTRHSGITRHIEVVGFLSTRDHAASVFLHHRA